MKNLTNLDGFVLESIRRILASKGYKFTISQISEKIKEISDLESIYNFSSSYQLWTKYNFDPPEPPYNYYFETQSEAQCFAERAKNKHNVNCDIDLIDYRKWKLTEKKELV